MTVTYCQFLTDFNKSVMFSFLNPYPIFILPPKLVHIKRCNSNKPTTVSRSNPKTLILAQQADFEKSFSYVEFNMSTQTFVWYIFFFKSSIQHSHPSR